VQTRFFAIALLPILDRQLKSDEYFSQWEALPSPERLIMSEIAYNHRDLIPHLFKLASDAIKHIPITRSVDNALLDLYEICFYLFRLGHHLEFLELIGTPTPANDQYLKRKFLVTIMSTVKPPFSKEFLRQMLECLLRPPIKSLFFPDKQKVLPAMLISALDTVARFTEQINRNEATRTYESDAAKFDELRREARRAVEIAKGVSQRTILSYM
jgi:hypothetical protein